jgi:putative DNA primase/helicase
MGIALKHLSEAERARIARTLFTVKSEDQNRGELIGICPIHGESNPSFSYNYKKDVYKCLSCNADGDLIRLWSEVHNLGQKEGFKSFCAEFSIKMEHDGRRSEHSHVAQEPAKTSGCNLPKNENGVCSHLWMSNDSGDYISKCSDESGEIKCCRQCADEVKSHCSSQCINSVPVQEFPPPAPGELTHEQVAEQMNRAWEKFPSLTMRMIADLKTKRGWSPSIIETLDLRLETWRLSKNSGELYQVKEPVKIAIPIRDVAGKLINIRLYQPGAKQYKIISFGKTTGQSALFPAQPLFNDKPVLLTEGESDTICALSHGFNAITQTSKLKNWPPEHLAPFEGHDVFIAYDADEAGQKYARFAAEALTGTASSIRMVQWPAFMGVDESGAVPRDHGQDLTDFFVRHSKSADDLQALIDNAAPWPPASLSVSEPPSDNLTQNADKNPVSGNEADAGTVDDTNDVLQFFDHGVNNRYSFRPRLLAEKIIQDIPIMYEPQTGLVYKWNDRYWEILHEDYLKTRCLIYLRNESNKGRAEDATFQAKMLSMIPAGRKINDRSGYFCVENGMYSIDEDKLQPHAKEFYATFMFPVVYDPDNVPLCVRWIKFLEETIQTPEVIAQVQEFFGYCLTPSTAFEKCLLCLGPGADGKSTLLKILREMVGAMNCAAVNIEDLDDQFQRSSLYGKLLNISTEVGSKAMESKIFKAIVSGDAVQAAYKHENSFEFVPTCKMAFAANRFPRVLDNSDGFFRKILPVQFKRQFLHGADKGLLNTLKGELSGIFHWALIGRERLWAQQDFTESDETNRLLLDYRRSNNPVLCFLEDVCELDPGGLGFEVIKKDLYNKYESYCREKGYSKFSEENFFRELKSARSNLEQYRPTIGGKREYVLKGIRIAVELAEGDAA